MKATDLRIGNLVFVPSTNQIIPITVINMDLGVVVNRSLRLLSFNEIMPIELTEEWLLKMGFEKIDNSNFRLGDYSILFLKNEIRFIICNYMDAPPSVKLKYLHELQNFYFALCDKELRVNKK